MPRDLGEEVVIHLVLETPAEPVHERCARDVAGGGHLKKAQGTRRVGAQTDKKVKPGLGWAGLHHLHCTYLFVCPQAVLSLFSFAERRRAGER